MLLSAVLVLLIAAAPVVYWRLQSRTSGRWFLAGAAIWACGVAIKVAFAWMFYASALQAYRSHLPYWAYLVMASLHSGALTGLFEGGGTLVAGLMWPNLARGPDRAVAVGLGAGGVEALLVGLSILAWVVAAPYEPSAAAELDAAVAATQAVWLVFPVERLIATLGHTSFRMLALLSVAKRRWLYAGYTFLLFTAGDGIATFLTESGRAQEVFSWSVSLALAPLAIVSIPIIRWCLRNWPAPSQNELTRPERV